MKNVFYFGDTINLEEHIIRFEEKQYKNTSVLGSKYIIYSTFGERISYKYQSVQQEHLENYIAFNTSIKHAFIPLRKTLQYHISKNIELGLTLIDIVILNPVVEDVIPIAVWSVVLPLETKQAYAETVLQSFDYDYLEQMSYHLQMVLINYEKLYYVVDIFSDLFISKIKDRPYHLTNVSNWSVQIANALNLSEIERMQIYIASLLHDIGKLYTDNTVLTDESKLDDQARIHLRSHVNSSYKITSALFYGMTIFKDVPKYVKYHHENFDGTGYPDGLKGEEIPLASRIIAVADYVDKMMHATLEPHGTNIKSMIEALKALQGKRFDPNIVEVMNSIIYDQHILSDHTSLEGAHFMPKATLSFQYEHKNYTLVGNLLTRKNQGKLILENEYSGFNQLDISKILNPTIITYVLNDLKEYQVQIDRFYNGQFEMSAFMYIPIDRYFSMIWEAPIALGLKDHEVMEVDMIKLGGDTVIIKVEDKKNQQLLLDISHSFKVSIGLKLDGAITTFLFDAKMTKSVPFANGYLFVLEFLNIATSERDKLLRTLFRKQVRLRQSKL